MTDGKNVLSFFARNDYFIDEKAGFFKFTNSYKIYGGDGVQIGSVNESMPAFLKILSLLISKALFPLKLDINDLEGNTLVTIKRGWTFFISKMEILDSGGSVIAFIKQKFHILKPSFIILDPEEKEIARIAGDWKAWNFTISGAEGEQIGTITKKWNGVLKEFFTTADKYVVSVNPGVDEAKKIPMLAAAITIDMVLKESK